MQARALKKKEKDEGDVVRERKRAREQERERESPFNEGDDPQQRVPDTIVTKGSMVLRTFPPGTRTISNYTDAPTRRTLKLLRNTLTAC